MKNKDEEISFFNLVDIEQPFVVNYFCCVCYQPAPVMENGTSFCKDHAKEHDHGRGKTICQMTDEFFNK